MGRRQFGVWMSRREHDLLRRERYETRESSTALLARLLNDFFVSPFGTPDDPPEGPAPAGERVQALFRLDEDTHDRVREHVYRTGESGTHLVRRVLRHHWDTRYADLSTNDIERGR